MMEQANNNTAVQTKKQIKYPFEEFKLYYESTEKVTDRRIANNNFNYSVCVAVLLAIGFLWNWFTGHPQYSYPGFTLIIVLSSIASLYTRLWLAQIRNYKQLNAAKFHVLNKMAPELAFNKDASNSDVDIVSCRPFETEWKEMDKLGGLQKRSRFNIIALKSSNLEYFIPNSFSVIFMLMAIAALIAVLFHPDHFFDQWKSLLQI